MGCGGFSRTADRVTSYCTRSGSDYGFTTRSRKKNEDKSFGEEKSTTGGNQDVSVVSTRNFNVNSNDLNLFFSAGQ